MTSPDPKSTPGGQADGGGMLPALLAGAGILAVAALFIFGGDDEKSDATEKDKSAQTQAASAHTANNPKGGVAARQTDDANNTGRPTPKLNPRIADAVVTEGMSPLPNKKPDPTSFSSRQAEIEYWEKELDEANKLLEMRQRAVNRLPGQEQKFRSEGTAEELAQFQGRKAIVEQNYERAQGRVDEIEDKLAALH